MWAGSTELGQTQNGSNVLGAGSMDGIGAMEIIANQGHNKSGEIKAIALICFALLYFNLFYSIFLYFTFESGSDVL